MQYRYSKYLPTVIYISDLICLNTAIIASALIHSGMALIGEPYLKFFLIISNFSWIAASLSGSFKIERPLVLSDNLSKFLIGLCYYTALLLGSLYFLQVYNVSRFILALHIGLFALFIFFERSTVFFILDYIRKKGYNQRRVLVIGNRELGDRLISSFNNHPEYGYHIVEYFSDSKAGLFSDSTVDKIIAEKDIHEIYICYKTRKQTDAILKLISRYRDHSVKINVITDFIVDNELTRLQKFRDFLVFRILHTPIEDFKIRCLKRGFDVSFSLFVMVAGLPVFILLVIATKFSSTGPVFYRQQRMGRNGQEFHIYKFRSMYVGAENGMPLLSSDNDPRITPWGRILRKTRLDELPQFYNVLKGEMSVVGPRPERQYFIEKIVEKAPEYRKLLSVKPGLTSIGQVYYGYAENVDQMVQRMRYDLLYLRKSHLRTDVGIIAKTVQVMVQGKGK